MLVVWVIVDCRVLLVGLIMVVSLCLDWAVCFAVCGVVILI